MFSPKKRSHDETTNGYTDQVDRLAHSVTMAVEKNNTIIDFTNKEAFDFYKKNIKSRKNDGGYLDKTVDLAFDNAIYSYFLKNPEHYYRIYYSDMGNSSPEDKQKADVELVEKKIRASLSLSSWLNAVGINVNFINKLKNAFNPKNTDKRLIEIKNEIELKGISAQEDEHETQNFYGIYTLYYDAAADKLKTMLPVQNNSTNAQIKKVHIDTEEKEDARQAKNYQNSTYTTVTNMLKREPQNGVAWESKTKYDFDNIPTNMSSYQNEKKPHLKKVIKLAAEKVNSDSISIKKIFEQHGIVVEQGSRSQTILQIYEDYYDKAQDVLGNDIYINNNKCSEHVEEIKNLRKEVEDLKNRILSLESKFAQQEVIEALIAMKSNTNNLILNSPKAQGMIKNSNNSNPLNQNNVNHSDKSGPQNGL
ncbi:MAG: hypothetical protein WC756_20780 [Taibaiella sp.]|jgi:hypothetical protein